MEKEETIIEEMGSDKNCDLYRVFRSFYLTTKEGPPEIISKGALVRLTPMTARMNFPNRIIPLSLKDPGQYEALAQFRIADSEGKWEMIEKGDVLELSFQEALPLLQRFQIKPLIGGDKK